MDRHGALELLATEAKRGELMFSAPAAVALRVRQGLDDPDCRAETAVQLIRAEPMLSARVVAFANSVVFNRSGRTITDVRAGLTCWASERFATWLQQWLSGGWQRRRSALTARTMRCSYGNTRPMWQPWRN